MMTEEQRDELIEAVEKKLGIIGTIESYDRSSDVVRDLFYFVRDRHSVSVCTISSEYGQKWLVFSEEPLNRRERQEWLSAVDTDTEEDHA